MFKITKEHTIELHFIKSSLHRVTFSKKDEPTQEFLLKNEEYEATDVIDAFHYLCSETKESIEFTKEDLFYISLNKQHRSERLLKFLGNHSLMLEIIQNIRNHSFIDESHLVFDRIKASDEKEGDYYITFRSTLINDLLICIIYDSYTENINDFFVHVEHRLYSLYHMYSNDVFSEKEKEVLLSIVKKNKTIRLKILLL